MMKRTFPVFFWGLVLFLSFSSSLSAYDGDDLGYIDAVTVNDRHFEDLDENEIVFYKEDLTDGVVVFRGILESETDKISVDKLAVEITLDGGNTWHKAKGHGEWEYHFRPELERAYEFGIRVLKVTTGGIEDLIGIQEVQLAMGPFTLSALVSATDKGLRGRGTLDLGFLNDYLPKQAKGAKPGIEVSFSGLKPNASMTKIESGSIRTSVSLDLDILKGVKFKIRSMEFSPEGARLTGALALNKGIYIPTIPFNKLTLTPKGIAGRLHYEKRGRSVPISILSGEFGIDLQLKKLDLDINTISKTLSLSNVDASLLFGDAFGEVKAQAVRYLDESWKWGSEAGNALGSVTIPKTSVKIDGIGGIIESNFKGITLAGKLEIPVFNEKFTIDLTGPSALQISSSGISTKGRLVLPDLKNTFALHDFTARAKSMVLSIKDNSISGQVKASLNLAKLRDTALDFTADIRSSGLTNIKAKIGPQVIPIPGFADLHLDKSAISVSSGSVSVSLDGYLDITHPSLQNLMQDAERDFGKESSRYYKEIGSSRSGTTLSVLSDKGRNAAGGLKKTTGNIRQQAKRGARQGKETAKKMRQFAFSNLKILKDRIELPPVSTGWYSFDSPMTANMTGLSLSAESWGIGSTGGSLWAGIKGKVDTNGAAFSLSARATAQFHLDGRFEILDFAANASLSMGPFTLHTDAVLSGGLISGSGVLVSNEPIPSIPDLLKDAKGNLNLDVRFTNLEASAGEILSGVIDVPLPEALDISLPLADIRLKALHFSPENALADAEIHLKGFSGIDAIKINTLSLGENGFSATGTVKPATPLSWTLFSDPNDLTVTIRSLVYAIDTGKMNFSISDLDADIKLGTNYGGGKFPLAFNEEMFRWGNTFEAAIGDAADQATESAQDAGNQAAEELSGLAGRLVIPGTDFTIKNPGGALTLGDLPSVSISGVIEIPGFDTPFKLPIPSETPLVISANGISTKAKITLDQLLDKIDLKGFPVIPKHLAFALTNNAIDLDLKGAMSLEKFGGISLDFSARFDGFGLDTLTIDANQIGTSVSLDGFAKLDLIGIKTGYTEENGFFVKLDCDITLTHPMLKDFIPLSSGDAAAMAGSTVDNLKGSAKSGLTDIATAGKNEATDIAATAAIKTTPLALRGLKIYRDAVDFGKALEGWRTLKPPATANIDQLQLMLQKWGVGAEGDRFWVGLKGAMALGGKQGSTNAEATAQFFSDGTFRLMDMDFAGEFSLGPFRLLTDAEYSNGSLSGSGVIVSDVAMPDIPAILKDEEGKLHAAVDFENLVVDTAKNLITDGLIALDTAFNMKAELTQSKNLLMAVRKLGFSPKGLALSGDITLPTLFGCLTLPALHVENLMVGLDGFSGTTLLAANWPEPARISILENLGVDIMLSGIKLSVNWSKPGIDKISLSDLSGSVDLGDLFHTLENAAKPVLAFAGDALTFTLPKATLPGVPDLGFSDIKGRIRFTENGIGFSLDSVALSMALIETDITIAGTGIQVGTNGLSGNFSLDSAAPVSLSSACGFSGTVNSLGVSLLQNEIISSSFGVELVLDKFFDLKLGIKGSITEDGIDHFHIDSDFTIQPINKFESLAVIEVNDLSAGYDKDSGLSLSVYPKVIFKHATLKTLESVKLDAVKFSKDAVDFKGIVLNQQLTNASIALGPVDLQITNIGLTIPKELTEISTTITGSAELGSLAKGTVRINASPTYFSIDKIKLKYDENGVKIKGGLTWDKAEDSFGVEAGITIAGVMKGDALIELGRVGKTNNKPAYTWWRVNLSVSAGAPIQLGTIPLSIYAFNGGLAYHMKATPSNGKVKFTPDGDQTFAFQAGVTLGTSGDYGYIWHGDLTLTIQPKNPIIFSGDTYFLKRNLGETGKRYLNASITIGVGEPFLKLEGDAKFLIDSNGFEIINVATTPPPRKVRRILVCSSAHLQATGISTWELKQTHSVLKLSVDFSPEKAI